MKKKSNKMLWWLCYIVGGLIVFLLGCFYYRKKSEKLKPNIVDGVVDGIVGIAPSEVPRIIPVKTEEVKIPVEIPKGIGIERTPVIDLSGVSLTPVKKSSTCTNCGGGGATVEDQGLVGFREGIVSVFDDRRLL
ncbi:hypothetical protein GWK08_08850 [Leptobacterium flavescens]|uniref:Uncharacterized protein n=1 Tax=Leptobacterium flavescens TaxID=472055 RepID=A0A6P0ULW4_9FLAO|nr:hypothetical protein [Leptobacterium flavescens]NER13542.1 hypothetical protein [Leptobacterium flavescens]